MTPLLHVLSIVVLLGSLPQQTDTCAASGVCGLSPYCYGSYPGYGSYGGGYSGGGGGGSYGGGCSSCCSGGCGGGYGCGSYGCYRMRARASNNFKPQNERGDAMLRALEKAARTTQADDASAHKRLPEFTEVDELEFASPTAAKIRRNPQSLLNPNRAFYECCQDRRLPDACLQKCNYNAYNKDALTRMYFKQDACPFEAMRELQFCAAQGGDHRECCARNGLTTTIAGAKCLMFCDQRPGQITQLDMSYVPCFDRFENMKSCFWNHLTRFRHVTRS